VVQRERVAQDDGAGEAAGHEKKIDDKKEAEEEMAAAEESDKRARLAGAFERVQARYENGEVGSAAGSPEKSEGGDSEREGSTSTERSYGRGSRKGQQGRAKGNPGLSPEPARDKLSEMCAKQADVADTVRLLAASLVGEKRQEPDSRAPSDAEQVQLKIQKVQATAALMDTYLKFQQSGVALPAMFQKVLDEGL
jgi:hypothetical protein